MQESETGLAAKNIERLAGQGKCNVEFCVTGRAIVKEMMSGNNMRYRTNVNS
jgi:hypothetical protein